jgi:hypothetical protein
VIFPGPVGVFVLVPGLRALVRNPRRRAIAIATVAPLAVFLIASGKGYYASPALAVGLVAGAVAITQRRARIPRLLVAGLVINLIVPLPLLVPVVPTSVLAESEDIAQGTEMGERLGWDDLAQQVADVRRSLPSRDHGRLIVIGDTYAIPAAIEYHAHALDLPPAVGGHNSAYLWWPTIDRDHIAIAIGFDRGRLDDLYADVEQVDNVRNRFGVHNYEWDKPIWVVRDPLVTPAELREEIRIFTA